METLVNLATARGPKPILYALVTVAITGLISGGIYAVITSSSSQ